MLGNFKHSAEFSASLLSPSLNQLMPPSLACRYRWKILASFLKLPTAQMPHHSICCLFEQMEDLFTAAALGLVIRCRYLNETIRKLLVETLQFTHCQFSKGLADSYLLCVGKSALYFNN